MYFFKYKHDLIFKLSMSITKQRLISVIELIINGKGIFNFIPFDEQPLLEIYTIKNIQVHKNKQTHHNEISIIQDVQIKIEIFGTSKKYYKTQTIHKVLSKKFPKLSILLIL